MQSLVVHLFHSFIRFYGEILRNFFRFYEEIALSLSTLSKLLLNIETKFEFKFKKKSWPMGTNIFFIKFAQQLIIGLFSFFTVKILGNFSFKQTITLLLNLQNICKSQ